MAEKTSKMIALLGRMRKEMNGAVADAMFCYGKPYGLNYGVSLPTVRTIARQVERSNELADYLFKQQVRELQLAAMHIALPEQFSTEQVERWGEGIINSEMAEEMAFALLRHLSFIDEVYQAWARSENEFKVYSALLSAAKCKLSEKAQTLEPILEIATRYPTSRPIAKGIVALLSEAYRSEEQKPIVKSLLESLEPSATADYIKE
ncbi:MAG: DNA alkylation repair protein, partial [Alistipes sp.]|nr:DNA alkylation repair protein [Alistipes sp.]